jgi:DNA-binding MarR family transcriptional regulator
MTSDQPLPALMAQLFGRLRAELAPEALGDMRMSHVRVLDGVGEGGVSVTRLAGEIGMTKQGCGQFVSQLEGSGHVSTSLDPSDRRVRLVHRTQEGDRLLTAVYADFSRIEQGLAAQVGERRYATFRKVLAELVARETAPGRRSPRT